MTHRRIDRAREPRELARVADDISLWWCDLDLRADADVERRAATLVAGEHARAARFGTDALRARWIAGRASLRCVLGRALRHRRPPTFRSRAARAGARSSRGIDGGLDFNVSHTGGVALIGILRTAGATMRIGVDVERADRDGRLPIAWRANS